MTDEWVARQRAQAAGFDAIGTRYDEVFAHKDGQVAAGERLLGRLRPGARVLDVGCGTGLPTAGQLAAAGCDVTGIDISPVMLDLARRNVPTARFLRRDVVDLAGDVAITGAPTVGTDPAGGSESAGGAVFGDGDAVGDGYDAVVAFFALLMLPRERIVTTLGTLRRALRPGGWLALAMVEADLDDVALPFLGVPLRLTGWPRDDLHRVVTDAGFTVEESDARTYAPPAPEAPPETQLFLLARRTGGRHDRS